MSNKVFKLPIAAIAFGMIAFAQDTVPVGTTVNVRTNDTIDMRDASDGRIFTGTVERDVIGRDGRIAIPRGANAELIVRNVGRDDLALDLESITVEGRRYVVSTVDQPYDADRKAGVGKNSRTGKYVGGGAVLGTIIGAIAGGGKGAAIGALAGGAAGAGTQTLTRGRNVHVPAESVLTFRLDQPLVLGRGDSSRDRGYDRDGRHYHDDSRDRPQDRDRQ
jgi:hypothetical protein